jgi:transcription elongation factor Elf1
MTTKVIVNQVCPECETSPSVTMYESTLTEDNTLICGNCGKEY